MPETPKSMGEFVDRVMSSGIQLIIAGQENLGRCVMAIAFCYKVGAIEQLDEHLSEFMGELVKAHPAAIDKVQEDFAQSVERSLHDGFGDPSWN